MPFFKTLTGIGTSEANTAAQNVGIVARVKWGENTGSYSINTVAGEGADFLYGGSPETEAKTAAALVSLSTGTQAYMESRAVYRQARSSGTGAYTIPLFQAVSPCRVSVFGVITESLDGASGNLSVGTVDNAQAFLGNLPVTTAVVPNGATARVWSPAYPYDSGTASNVSSGAAVPFDTMTRLMAPGEIAYLNVPSPEITTGDITFEIQASREGVGDYTMLGLNKRRSPNGNPTHFQGRIGVVIPAF